MTLTSATGCSCFAGGMVAGRAKKPTLRRPYSLRRGVRRLLSPAAVPENRGRAGRQGSRAHPSSRDAQTRTLGPAGPTPRDIEACRSRPPRASRASRVFRKSAKPNGVPRAVFLGLLRSAPGGLTLSGNPPLLSDCQAAYPPLAGPGREGMTCDRSPPRHHGAPWRAAGAPGRLRLGPPGPCTASPMQRHSPATAPRPASEDADQTPLGNEGRMRTR